MARVKVNLGKWTNKQFVLPDFDGTMEHLKGESIMFFGWNELNGRKFRPFFGVGKVYRVVKGDECDLVYVNFGMQGIEREHTPRLVVCYDNHARRQTLTLKRGQHATIFGISRFYTKKITTKSGEQKEITNVSLYATGLQGWYVPTMLDIRKMPKNDDLVNPSEWEESIIHEETDILDMFFKGED